MSFVPKNITIRHGDEYWEMNHKGWVIRPGLVSGSPSWRVVGAVRFNNFGHWVRRYSLEEILQAPSAIPWQHKNGRQRVHILDHDHGAMRMWGSPGHTLYHT